jgi:hypothetical protein
MKRLILTLTLALASALLFIPVGYGAAKRGYSCTYAKAFSGIRLTVTIDGYDNGAYFCRMLNSGLRGTRIYGRVHGPVACAWKARELDVRISIRVSGGLGRAACTLLDSMWDGNGTFVRTK